MEPLSLAASVAGLVSLADVVFTKTYRYVRNVKNAESEILSLADELQSLSGLLHSLRLRMEELDDEVNDGLPFYRPQHIDSCHQTLDKIKQQLDKSVPQKSRHRDKLGILNHLTWPFSSSETKALLQRVERDKIKIILALSEDSLVSVRNILSSQKQLESRVEEIKMVLQRKRTWETTLETLISDEQNKKVLQDFGRVEPYERHEASLNLRHPQTGQWLIDSPDFAEWSTGKISRLWLSGIPGAGKTILASLLIDETKTRVGSSNGAEGMAYFYCDYKDEETQDLAKILGSLASQLAMQNKRSFDILSDYHEKFFPPNKSIRSQRPSMIGVIREMCGEFDNVSIIIDALDECGNNVKEVVKGLASLNNGQDLSIRTLFLSREEDEIAHLLVAKCVHIPISARSHDLDLYVRAQIEDRTKDGDLTIESIDLKEDIIDTLVKKADGMFRWVACQLDHLCELPHDKAIRNALGNLPPDLNSTYERILARVGKNEHAKEMVQNTLRWTVLSKGRLSFNELREALSLHEGMTRLDTNTKPSERAILRACSSLIRKSTDGTWIELAHFTVEEYLRNVDSGSEFFAYRVDPSLHTGLMAKICLTYLNLTDFDQAPFRNFEEWTAYLEVYPFRIHAAWRWFEYAEDHWEDPFVQGAARQLFHPRKSSNFLTWAQDSSIKYFISDEMDRPPFTTKCTLDDYFEEKTSHFISQGITPLHYACILRIEPLIIWLLDEGCEVNQKSCLGAPLHCALSGETCLINQVKFGASSVDTIELLIQAGANVTSHHRDFGKDSWSPLNIILESLEPFNTHKQEIRSLLKAGAELDEISIDIIERLQAKCDKEEFSSFIQLLKPPRVKESCISRYFRIVRQFNTPSSSSQLAEMVPSSLESNISAKYLFQNFLSAAQNDQAELMGALIARNIFSIDTTDEQHEMTALHFASKSGSVEAIKFLLHFGSDVHKCDFRGRTALHFCASTGNTDALALLIQNGSDISQADNESKTIWNLASEQDDAAVLKYLVHLNKLNSKDPWTIPPGGLSPLLSAASHGSQECLDFLVKWAQKFDVTTPSRETLVHYCAYYSEESLKLFLEHNLDLEIQNQRGLTALHTLCITVNLSNPSKVKMLLESGANRDTRTATGDTALHLLVSQEEILPQDVQDALISTIPLLATTTTINHVNSKGLTPLLSFIRHGLRGPGSIEIAKNLVSHGAQIEGDGTQDLSCINALVDLIREGPNGGIFVALDMLVVMLDLLPVDFTLSKNLAASSALTIAVGRHDEELMRKLLARGSATHMVLQDHGGFSALENACLQQIPLPLFRLLLEHTQISFLHRLSPESRSSLLHWMCTKHYNVQTEYLEVLLETGIPVDMVDAFQDTALLKTAQSGKVPHARLLLQYGANINRAKERNVAAIHAAVWEIEFDNSEMIRFLISKGAHVNAKLLDGTTPLHLAAARGQVGYVEVLLEHGASSTEDFDGLTPELLAYTNGHQNVADLISHMSLQSKDCPLPNSNADADTFQSQKKRIWRLLTVAIDTGDASLCEKIIDQEKDIDCYPFGCNGCTPVLYALDQSRVEIAKILIDKGCSTQGVVCQIGAHPGYTALHLASKAPEYRGCLESLLQRSLHLPDYHTSGPVHPIHVAVTQRNNEGLALLLNHYANISSQSFIDLQTGDMKDATRNSATMASTAGTSSLLVSNPNEHHRLSQSLRQVLNVQVRTRELRHEFVLNPAPHLTSRILPDATPLHIAAFLDNFEAAKLLLSHGADVDSQGLHLGTPLHQAAITNSLAVARILLGHGADVEATNAFGETPIMLASRGSHLVMMELLDQVGANFHARDLFDCNLLWSITDKRCFAFATQKGCQLQCSTMDSRSYSYNFGSNVLDSLVLNYDALSTSNLPPGLILLFALSEPRHAVWNIMLRRTIQQSQARDWINSRLSENGVSLLYGTISFENTRYMELLIENGADIEIEGSDDGTPLMYACSRGRQRMVEVLVRKGARLFYNRNGETISSLKAAGRYPRIKEWILVGRFTQQPKLEAAERLNEDGQQTIRPWTGPKSMAVPLRERYGRFEGETMLDHIIRLRRIRQNLLGKVLAWDGDSLFPYVVL